MVQAVFFDLGGTLLEYQPIGPRKLFKHAARNSFAFLCERGCPLPSFRRYYRTQRRKMTWERIKAAFSGREVDSRKMLRNLCIDLRLQRDPGTINLLGAQWYEPVAQRAQVAPDAFATLRQLRESSIRLGIIANAPVPGEVIDEHLASVGLLPFFETRVYSSEIGYRKPSGEIFDAALKEMDLEPQHAAYVGDSRYHDVKGARRAGMISILKSNGSRGRADYVIRRLGELPAVLGVGHVIEEPPLSYHGHPARA